MISIKTILVIVFSAINLISVAQNSGSCGLCNMDINDARFLAKAETINGKIVHFDAIECLVNYLKENQADVKNVWVAAFSSKKVINAKTAYYLKSKGVPSPMGAYISAYATEAEAKAMQKQKGGEVFNWAGLKAKFKNSIFGSIYIKPEHNVEIEMYCLLNESTNLIDAAFYNMEKSKLKVNIVEKC